MPSAVRESDQAEGSLLCGNCRGALTADLLYAEQKGSA